MPENILSLEEKNTKYIHSSEVICFHGKKCWEDIQADAYFFPRIISTIKYRDENKKIVTLDDVVLKNQVKYSQRLNTKELAKTFGLNHSDILLLADTDFSLCVDENNKGVYISLRGFLDFVKKKKQEIVSEAPDKIDNDYLRENQILLSKYIDPEKDALEVYSKQRILDFYHALFLDLHKTALRDDRTIWNDNYRKAAMNYLQYELNREDWKKAEKTGSDVGYMLKTYTEFPLLTRKEELELAKKIEECKIEIFKYLVEEDFVLSEIKNQINESLKEKPLMTIDEIVYFTYCEDFLNKFMALGSKGKENIKSLFKKTLLCPNYYEKILVPISLLSDKDR